MDATRVPVPGGNRFRFFTLTATARCSLDGRSRRHCFQPCLHRDAGLAQPLYAGLPPAIGVMGVMLLSMSGELLFNDEVALVFSMAFAMIHGPVAPGIGQVALLLLREAGDKS